MQNIFKIFLLATSGDCDHSHLVNAWLVTTLASQSPSRILIILQRNGICYFLTSVYLYSDLFKKGFAIDKSFLK